MARFNIGDLVETTFSRNRYEIESFTYEEDGGFFYVFKDTDGMRWYGEQGLELVRTKEDTNGVVRDGDLLVPHPDYYKSLEEPKKFDSGKPRMDLIRPEFTLALGECLGYGATKYDEPRGDTPNYLKGDGFNYSTIIASLERHIAAFKMGEDIDEESGLNHLAHSAVNLMFLHTYSLCDKGIDDRVVLGGRNESKDKEIT